MDIREQIKAALPEKAIGRYDLLPLFQRPQLFEAIVYHMSARWYGKIDYVAAPEALGWILGAAMAARLHVGFIALRKGGRLPYRDELLATDAYTDSSGQLNTLALVKASIKPGSRVVVVDEWIETGAQVNSTLRLLDGEGLAVAGLATIGINCNAQTQPWVDSGFVDYLVLDE